LDYRLRNYKAVRESTFDVPEFTPELRDLARSLGAAVAPDPELASEIISLLEPADKDARARRTVQPDYVIVMVLLALVHEGRKKQLLVREIATAVNSALYAYGEILEYSPEEIGWRLLRLALYTGRMAGGRGLRFDRDLSRALHNLARRFAVEMPNVKGCPDCGQVDQPYEPKALA
jgi:hypothetical protein